MPTNWCTEQDRTGQDRTGQDSTAHYSTEHDRTGQNTEQNRTRKDRTGQDRTGQNRTGQDRTEQDRRGQDRTEHRTGQDRIGQDRTQNRTGQDRAGQERTEENSTAQNKEHITPHKTSWQCHFLTLQFISRQYLRILSKGKFFCTFCRPTFLVPILHSCCKNHRRKNYNFDFLLKFLKYLQWPQHTVSFSILNRADVPPQRNRGSQWPTVALVLPASAYRPHSVGVNNSTLELGY